MPSSLSNYGFLRVGAAAPELKVADVDFNVSKILDTIDEACKKDCSLLVFPELCISGYSCGDLFYQQALLKYSLKGLEKITKHTGKTKPTAIVGLPLAVDGKLFNCAALISSGEVKGIIPKTYLCNTNEYYEERWFSSEFDRVTDSIEINGSNVPFGADIIFKLDNFRDSYLGIEICEDLWAVLPPSSYMALAGANLIVNLSASDEILGKAQYRRQLVKSQSARCFAAYAYSSCGAGESTTDVIYSGACMLAENGIMLAESERFRFDSQIAIADVDLERMNIERRKNNSFGASLPDKIFRKINILLPELKSHKLLRNYSVTPFVPTNKKNRADACQEIFSIQSTALAKRLKHINSSYAVIGISGGLDSTLALLVTVKAFKQLNLNLSGVRAITMPGFGTTEKTLSNAENLAAMLGVNFRKISISESVNLHFKDIKHDSNKKDIVYENAQARERTQILMDIANQVGGIVVGTGDLSELALGWSTYSGDHISMYGVNSGVPKTLVKYIIDWCADEEFDGEISKLLKNVSATPISPELLPPDEDGKIIQQTEKTIGPYILHDFFLYYAIRCHFSPKKVFFIAKITFESTFTVEEILKWLKVFYSRFFANQFKRSCLPDGVKVGTVALSPRGDWRMPSDASAELWLKELDEIR